MKNDAHHYCRTMLEEQRRQHDKDMEAMRERVRELEKLVDSKFEAQALAVKAARESMAARLGTMNEFREQLAYQAQTFANRDVIETAMINVERRIGSLERKMASYDGRIVGWSAGVGFIVLVLAIVTQLLGLGG